MRQQVHFAWGGVSLLLAGVGYYLGTIEVAAEAQPSAPPLACALAHRADPPGRAATSAPGAPGQPSPGPRPKASGSVGGESAPAAPADASLSPAGAASDSAEPAEPTEPLPVRIFERTPTSLALALDPDAEALVRALLRIGPLPEGDPAEYLADAISNLNGSISEERYRALVRAAFAYAPEGDAWRFGGVVGPDLVAVANAKFEAAPSPETLSELIQALSYAPDPVLIERLARANPDDEALQALVAAYLPERARELFSLNGLTRSERVALVSVEGNAALALELLAEEFDRELLRQAYSLDPEATLAAVEKHAGDPRWRGAGTLLGLQAHLEAGEEDKALESFARGWRELDREQLVQALEELQGWTDGSWRPAQREALESLLVGADEETTDELLYLAPADLRWKILRNSRAGNLDPALEVENYISFLSERPFRAREQLGEFLDLLPQLGGRAALSLAATFQELGDSQAAAIILNRAQDGIRVRQGRELLSRSLSLDTLTYAYIEGEDDPSLSDGFSGEEDW